MIQTKGYAAQTVESNLAPGILKEGTSARVTFSSRLFIAASAILIYIRSATTGFREFFLWFPVTK